MVSRDQQRDPDAVGGTEALRARLARAVADAEAAQAAADALRRKLAAITDTTVDIDSSVAARIRAFYRQNPSMSFSPVELADAIHAQVETVRKTLQRMADEIEHAGYGAYGVSEDFFKLNGWDAERIDRDWHD